MAIGRKPLSAPPGLEIVRLGTGPMPETTAIVPRRGGDARLLPSTSPDPTMPPVSLLATLPDFQCYLPTLEAAKLALMHLGDNRYQAINDFLKYDWWGLRYRAAKYLADYRDIRETDYLPWGSNVEGNISEDGYWIEVTGMAPLQKPIDWPAANNTRLDQGLSAEVGDMMESMSNRSAASAVVPIANTPQEFFIGSAQQSPAATASTTQDAARREADVSLLSALGEVVTNTSA